MMPPIISSGISTATSEILIDTIVKPISPAPEAPRRKVSRLLDISRDVFQDDDRVVDDESTKSSAPSATDCRACTRIPTSGRRRQQRQRNRDRG